MAAQAVGRTTRRTRARPIEDARASAKHLHRPDPAAQSGVFGADVRRHRCAVPAPGRRAGGGARHLGNDGLRRARRGQTHRPAAPRRPRRRPACRAACRLRSALDGRRRAHCRGRRRRHHRRQHGLPGQARHQRRVRFGADARPRSCAHFDRGGGAGRRRAGDAENAARLGRPQPQRAGAGAARRTGRRAARHRAWPHALPVLQGPRRLGGGARRQGGGGDPRRRQRRHRKLSTTPTRRSRRRRPTP